MFVMNATTLNLHRCHVIANLNNFTITTTAIEFKHTEVNNAHSSDQWHFLCHYHTNSRYRHSHAIYAQKKDTIKIKFKKKQSKFIFFFRVVNWEQVTFILRVEKKKQSGSEIGCNFHRNYGVSILVHPKVIIYLWLYSHFS